MSVVEANWDYYRDTSIGEENYPIFENKILSLLTDLEKYFKTQTFINSINNTENQEHELSHLLEQNKKLRIDVDKKQEQCKLQKDRYDALKKDLKILTQEIKNTHESFLIAKKYYKKHLKMYYTFESKNEKSQAVFVQFFTESKKESNNFSVCLLRNINTGCYEIQKTTPNLASLKEIQQKLQESNDVPGALCCIRQAFLDLNMKKIKNLEI